MTPDETKRHVIKRRKNIMFNKRKDEDLEDYGDSRKSDQTYGELLEKLANSNHPIFNDDDVKSDTKTYR